MALQWDDQHLQPQQKSIRRLMNTLQYLRHYAPQIFWELFDDVYSILKRTHLETFSITSTIFIHILSVLWRR